MLIFFRYALLNEWRLQFPSKKYFFILFLSHILTLWTYALTSKAFTPFTLGQASWMQMNYFSYVVFGEIILMLPLSLMEVFTKSIRFIFINKLELELITGPRGLVKLSFLSVSMILREFVYLVTFILFAYGFFDFQIQIGHLLLGLGMVFISLPLFLAIGVFIGMFVLITGRGSTLTSHINFFFSICAGVYFPLEVFSPVTREWLKLLAPPTRLLSGVREFYFSFTPLKYLDLIIYFLVWAVILWSIVLFLYPHAVARLRKNGRPILIIR